MPDIFELYTIPLDEWIRTANNWVVDNYRWVFQGLRWPVEQVLNRIEDFFLFIPPVIFLILAFLIIWRMVGWRIALFSVLGLTFLGFLGVWEDSMTTLAMVISALLFCAIVGVPLGILAARSDRFEAALRPVLDTMQTTPSFVYLVPVAMLIGIGTVAGVMATIIFAIPPIIRLTNLGIRQVQSEVVEAAYAFGATPMQVLREIQIPLALRTIMAGLNQTLMLALAMVVIASIIGAGGLGDLVRQGINNLQPGVGFVGGLGIVLLAIILDRITQALGRPQTSRGGRRLSLRGAIRSLSSGAGRQRPPRTEDEEAAQQAESEREKISSGSR
jgi:glycine betaine/proline transport system permease protein